MFRNHFATVLILLINIIQNILDNTQKSGSYASYFMTHRAHKTYPDFICIWVPESAFGKTWECRGALFMDKKFTVIFQVLMTSFVDRKSTAKDCSQFRGFYGKFILGTSLSVICWRKIHSWWSSVNSFRLSVIEQRLSSTFKGRN